MTPNIFGTLCIVFAVFADLGANICIKRSDGFRRKGYGLGALIGICTAFISIGIAIHYIDLSVSYSLFGALSLLCTTIVDKLFFHLQIKPLGILGFITMIGGIVLLQTA